jgi:N-carbamoyl-L-amino-acid hydrolase
MSSLYCVDGARLQASLEQIADYGATDRGGVTRITLSEEDRLARQQLRSWFEDAGCELHVDPIGNMFAVRRGINSTLRPVLTGSHCDSQPRGGKFDGILGILAGLEVVRRLNELKIELERDLIVVNWTNEEGSRFTPGCTGSGVWAGTFDLEEMYKLTDRQGTTLVDALTAIGFKGESALHPLVPHAAFELHIEQGPLLHRRRTPIGVPRGIVCLRWYDVSITGAANHAGTTPMELRSDALYAFSRITSAICEIAIGADDVVATVGEIHVVPNSRNVIPSTVVFTIDVRGWDEKLTDEVCRDIEQALRYHSAEARCRVSIPSVWKEPPTEFDRRLVAMVETTAEDLGLSWLSMVSGASHDMMFVSQVGPGAMIFVPSIDGISHSELEQTSPADCAAGADVLLNCIIRTANEKEQPTDTSV